MQGIDDREFNIKIYSPTCFHCMHRIQDEKRTCKAFPDGIPLEIWNGDNDHKKPYKGDNGIMFESGEYTKKIEIDIQKLERGTHKGRVKVIRGGKTFWREQRVGRKEKESRRFRRNSCETSR